MNVLIVLSLILFILMVLIGGKKGARSFIALFFNFVVLFFAVLFMTDPNANPIVLILIACTLISCVNLFFINEVNIKTITAFISTIVTFIILLFFIVLVTESTMIQGFGVEEIDDFSTFSLFIGIDFMKLAVAVIITSTIGAIVDIAISISSPMREIAFHNPKLGRKELFHSGISIGRDILGTSTNTLFFAFFGGYLALLIMFKDVSYSFGQIVNSKVFSAEMLTILVAGIGVALTIPITAIITAFALVRK
ncbi:YibE/F family protein [Bacillus sp. FJAT-45066]|uniref:YibE/F family protein n=1 Tax=Bacillus sp. FJAT-45066 TaxID=2011010 RepID=UPI000BB6B71B|nr:YibE/F family protein [Bacillus sp. FJAT-45066]